MPRDPSLQALGLGVCSQSEHNPPLRVPLEFDNVVSDASDGGKLHVALILQSHHLPLLCVGIWEVLVYVV